jgi:fibrillarin-like pre-rRNA processing protein
MMKIRKTKFSGIFKLDNKLVTINLDPGEKVYGEELIRVNNIEYREWIPSHSKPAAAIKSGIRVFPLEKGMSILYLGAASGTTVSVFSDIVGKEGIIYAVEISEKPLHNLMKIAERRGNVVCILNDARLPERYENVVIEKVDCLYEDVADPDQIKILIRNCEKFLKPKGYAIIAIKSQSIDSVRPPKEIYKKCLEELKKHFEILDKVELDPFQKNHLFIIMKLR